MKARMAACSRRAFMKTVGVGTTLLALPRRAPAAERPNFVLIMADDLGYGDVGCYGNTRIKTPCLDALAAGGMRFTDFHSNGPVCSPTRAALLTGRYQQRCGIEGVVTAKHHRDTGMALGETTFAEVLKAAGYSTALFGKWHLGYQVRFNPVKQGFDVFRGYVSGNVDYQSHIDQVGIEDWWHNTDKADESGYTTDLITEHAVRFIEQHKHEPFCLYLPHEAPHYPYQGRKDKADRAPGGPKPTRGSRQDVAEAYREMVEAMDEGVGRVVATLKRLGIEQRTLVFFCSDNGPAGPGSAGALHGSKGSLWEGGHRVPAMAYWPGRIKPGTVTDATAMTMDLFPTVAAIAGAALPPGLTLDGTDLSPVLLLRGELPAGRALFWRFKGQKAVREGPWKLLVNAKGKDQVKPVGLYNLADDLGETKDLAEAEPARVRALQAALAAWEQDVLKGVELKA